MTTFKDINLQVGARLEMRLQQGTKQFIYYSELIGYLDGEYLIVKIPFKHGNYVRIQVKEQITLRILSGVAVFTFTCVVKTIFSAPHHYMHLSFPTEIQSVLIRNAIRAEVELPVQVNGMDGLGVITDISVTGARIIADRVLGESDSEAFISFKFPIKPTNQSAHIVTSATIRSIQQVPSKIKDAPAMFSHGILFHELNLTDQMMLLNLVYEVHLNKRL